MNALAVGVDQPGALAAQRLGQQEARRARHGERGRVELHELEVGDARAGRPGHRDPVAGRHLGVGRLAEHLAGAAGREQRRAGAGRPRRAVRIQIATPTARPSSTRIAEARACSTAWTRGCAAVRAHRAGRSRGRWCRARAARGGRCAPPRGPARPRRSASRSKAAPQSISSSTSAGPSRTRMRTASTSQSPSPAASVSFSWRLGRRRRPPRRRCRPGRSRCCPRPRPALVSSEDVGRTPRAPARPGARRSRCRR